MLLSTVRPTPTSPKLRDTGEIFSAPCSDIAVPEPQPRVVPATHNAAAATTSARHLSPTVSRRKCSVLADRELVGLDVVGVIARGRGHDRDTWKYDTDSPLLLANWHGKGQKKRWGDCVSRGNNHRLLGSCALPASNKKKKCRSGSRQDEDSNRQVNSVQMQLRTRWTAKQSQEFAIRVLYRRSAPRQPLKDQDIRRPAQTAKKLRGLVPPDRTNSPQLTSIYKGSAQAERISQSGPTPMR